MEMTWTQFKRELEEHFGELSEAELDHASHIFLSDGSITDAIEEIEKMYDSLMADMDESMDGDFDSAMASAGFGTDEDYGYFGEDF